MSIFAALESIQPPMTMSPLDPGFKKLSHEQKAKYDLLKQEYLAKRECIKRRHRHSKLELALLLTCKQIYEEAGLMPYELNTFSFVSGDDMDFYFSGKLQSHQREVVRSVQIAGWLSAYEPEMTRILTSIRPRTIDLLKDLTSVEIILDLRNKPQHHAFKAFYGRGIEPVRVLHECSNEVPDMDECGEECCELQIRAEEIENLIKGRSGT